MATVAKDCCPDFVLDAPDPVKSFFRGVRRFCLEGVFIIPELLRFFKIDAVFEFVGLALGRIELKEGHFRKDDESRVKMQPFLL